MEELRKVDSNIKEGLYYLLLFISSLIFLLSIAENFSAITDDLHDPYIFMEPVRAFYYAWFWLIVFIVLLLFTVYAVIKRKRKRAVILVLTHFALFVTSFSFMQ